MTTQSSQSVLINGFGVLFVIFNSFGLGLRLSVGKLLAQAFAHWKIAVWALVINFIIIPLLFIGYLLTVASSIPGEIKVGFCVAALCAGMPFAPLLARLAKADVSISTTLLVLLTVGTVIALPLGLPSPSMRLTRNSRPPPGMLLGRSCSFAPAAGSRVRLQGLVARPDAAIGTVGCPSCDSVSALQSQLHAGCVLGSVRGDLGHRELHRGLCRSIYRPRVWLPSRFQSSSQRRGNQACDRGDHRGTQHRSDAPDDDLPLCSRPAGHGVDHDPQHHRHRDHSAVRPNVEARCFTVGHSRNNESASERRPAPANFDVTTEASRTDPAHARARRPGRGAPAAGLADALPTDIDERRGFADHIGGAGRQPRARTGWGAAGVPRARLSARPAVGTPPHGTCPMASEQAGEGPAIAGDGHGGGAPEQGVRCATIARQLTPRRERF